MATEDVDKLVEWYRGMVAAAEKDREHGRASFARELPLMRDRATRLGLYRTAHRLHDAIREMGWELAGIEMPESEKKLMYSKLVDQ